MARRTVTAAILTGAALLFSLPFAAAHEKSQHRGAAIDGTLSGVSKDTVTLKSNADEITIELSPDTVVQQDGQRVSRDVLTTGKHVTVFGPKLPGGRVAAREIELDSAGHGAKGPGESKPEEGRSGR